MQLRRTSAGHMRMTLAVLLAAALGLLAPRLDPPPLQTSDAPPLSSPSSFFPSSTSVHSRGGGFGAILTQAKPSKPSSPPKPSVASRLASLERLVASQQSRIAELEAEVAAGPRANSSSGAATVVLTTDPRVLPGPGYSAFPLRAGGGHWTAVNISMGRRSDHGVVAHGKYVYIIGGLSAFIGQPRVLDWIVRFDTETGINKTMAPLPGPRFRFATALLGDRVYVMGGTDRAGYDGLPLDSVLVYSISNNSWSTAAPMATKRIDACAAAADGKVYVFGGFDDTYASLGSVEEFDPAFAGSNTTVNGSSLAGSGWRVLPAASNMLSPRADCRAATLTVNRTPTSTANRTTATTIMVAGGVQYFVNPNASCAGDLWVNCYRMLSSVEAFDPAAQLWTPRASMRSPRADFAMTALPSGRLLVAGGERGNGTQFQLAMDEVEEYDGRTDVWVARAPLPEARFRTDMAYVGGRAYIFGGVPSCERWGGLQGPDACHLAALSSASAYHDNTAEAPGLYAVYKGV